MQEESKKENESYYKFIFNNQTQTPPVKLYQVCYRLF